MAAHQLGTTRPGDWRALSCPHDAAWKARVREAAEAYAQRCTADLLARAADALSHDLTVARDAPRREGLLAALMELDAVAADLDSPHGPNSCSVYVFDRRRVIRWRESLHAYLAASRQAEPKGGA
jgi:hypothetical protein